MSTMLRPPFIPAARADVVDLVRAVLAQLPAFGSEETLPGTPLLMLVSRPIEARRRLSDEVPTKDDDEEEEDLDDDDDVIVDEEEEDEEEDEDDWDEDDEDDWDEDDDEDDDDWDDEEGDDDEDEDDEEDEGGTPAVRLSPPARRRR